MRNIFKILNGNAPLIMGNLFILWENGHDIRNFQVIFNKDLNNMGYGVETEFYAELLI